VSEEKTPDAEGPDSPAEGEELTRRELEREEGEHLPDREGTLNALSDQATRERHPEAHEETTTKGGLDV
jgi:hypothetical protein